MRDSWRSARWAWNTVAELRAEASTFRPDRAVGAVQAPDHRLLRRGVVVGLKLRRAKCLESALVMQEVLRTRGRYIDVIIGAKTDSDPTVDFAAHAWLDGDDADENLQYTEMYRIPCAR